MKSYNNIVCLYEKSDLFANYIHNIVGLINGKGVWDRNDQLIVASTGNSRLQMYNKTSSRCPEVCIFKFIYTLNLSPAG